MMKYKNNEVKAIEKELSYILEILRGEYLLRTNIELAVEILKILYMRLLSEDSRDENIWKEFQNRLHSADNFIRFREYNIGTDIEINSGILFEKFDKNLVLDIVNLISGLKIYVIDNSHDMVLLFIRFAKAMIGIAYPNIENTITTDEMITELLSKIVDIEEGDLIYDPFAGTGFMLLASIIANKVKRVKVVANDIHPKVVEILIMTTNLYSYSLFDINVEDYFDSYNINNKKKYDLVISHIPTINAYHLSNYISNSKRAEWIIIENLVNQINYSGRAYLVVPNRTLFSGGTDKKRRYNFLNDDFIEAVIEVVPNKSQKVQLAVLIINKDKKTSRAGLVQILRFNGENTSIIEDIEKFRQSEHSRVVSVKEIQKKNGILNFSHYDPIYDEVAILLGKKIAFSLKDKVELIKPVSTTKIDKVLKGYPYIKVKNLQRSIEQKNILFDEGIDFVDCKNEEVVVEERTLIISLYGNDLKPTIFDPKKSKYKSIIIASNCIGIRIKDQSDDVTLDYLYYQFYNTRVLKQIEGYRRGATIDRITYSDLLSVVVMKPEYEDSIQLANYKVKSIIEIEEYRDKYELLVSDLENKIIDAEKEIVNMLIHNVGKHVSKIGHDIMAIRKFLDNQDLLKRIINEEDVEQYNVNPMVEQGLMPPLESVKVIDVVDRVERTLGVIEETFEDTHKTVNLKLNATDFELLNILELVDSIKDQRNCCGEDRYRIIVEGENANLHVHKQSFMEMLNILIDNAEVHGFKGRIGNEVKFIIKNQRSKVVIDYSNNGNPFKLTKDEFILVGKKSSTSPGSGQGGAYLNRVVISHGGEFVIDNAYKGTHFIFSFRKEETEDEY